MVKFTAQQKLWLETRGGRTTSDVIYIGEKPFILVRRGSPEDKRKRIDVPIPIPLNKDIRMQYQKTSHGNYRICQFKNRLQLKNKEI